MSEKSCMGGIYHLLGDTECRLSFRQGRRQSARPAFPVEIIRAELNNLAAGTPARYRTPTYQRVSANFSIIQAVVGLKRLVLDETEELREPTISRRCQRLR